VNWTWLADGTGIIAPGTEEVYLVLQDRHKGEVTGVRLTRYLAHARKEEMAGQLQPLRDGVRNVIVMPLGRGPGRPAGEPELAALMETAREYAEKYEAGGNLVGYPAWQREPLPLGSYANHCPHC
jgi:hypothetical protein